MRQLLLTPIFALLFMQGSWAMNEPIEALNINPATHNFGWKIHGVAPIAPSLVFDNGRKVYLKFRVDAEIPTIFVETERGLILLNWASEPPYIVVPNIKGALRLHLDGNEARVSKKGYYESTAPLLVAAVQEAPEPDPLPTPPEPTVAEAIPIDLAVPALPLNLAEDTLDTAVDADPILSEDTVETPTPPLAVSETPTEPPLVEQLPPPPLEEWQVSDGQTLKEIVSAWAERADWHMEWIPKDLNYGIDAPFVLKGGFSDVITQLFELYADAKRPFKVGLQEEQRVIVINERKRK